MPVESAADRATFVDPDDFGIAITYTLTGGSPVNINVIFDDPYEALDLGGEASFEASKPEITVRESDLPSGHANGDGLVINGANYRRVDYRPDHTGMGLMRVQET